MNTKTVFTTIVGRANAGKSSLLNALVGEKIAMVSNKPQTTRTRITGILNVGEIQLVFMDTPGLHKAKNKLGEHMMKTVKDSVTDVDVMIYMFDCTSKITEQDKEILSSINKSSMKCILALNKIDLLKDKTDLAKLINMFNCEYGIECIIPVSVLNGDGVEIILNEVIDSAVESPHYFPDDMLTDQPEKVLAAEIVREKFLCLLNEEVPHGIAVGVEEMKEREDKDILNISAVIYCERESHKGIVIGKGGAMLKRAATLARQELEQFFQIKVNLQCWVKVKEDWRNKEGLIRSFGLNNQ